MPVTKVLEETLYQAATLEGKFSESPSMRHVMQNTAKADTVVGHATWALSNRMLESVAVPLRTKQT